MTDGVILVDKPAGVTSHDVVAGVRRSLGRGVKVGHAGTLDPFATGLLLVLVGRATRVQRFLMALPKRYFTVARLGYVSSTGDVDGDIASGRMPALEYLPTGTIRQRPPAYSAVKVGGERAYAMARRGEAVELPERSVHVSRFELMWRDGERAGFEIECSSGTYVRALIADLGDAYCLELRRTGIGPFEVGGADPERVVPLDEALSFLPAVELTGDAARRAGHGVAVDAVDAGARGGAADPGPHGAADPGPHGGAADPGPHGVVRLRDDAGLIALAEPRADGTLKPVVGFRG